MINQQTLQGRWNEIRGKLRERWGALTRDDLERFQGSGEELVGLIQRKTGEGREAIEQFIEEALSQAGSTVGRATEAAKRYAQQTAETFQDSGEEVARRVREGFSEAGRMVQRRPAESVAVAFGAGLIAGVIVGLILRK